DAVLAAARGERQLPRPEQLNVARRTLALSLRGWHGGPRPQQHLLAQHLALLGLRAMSDLRPQSEPNRTLIRSLSPIAIFIIARPSTTLADLLREASHSAMRASPPSRSTEKSWPHFRPSVVAIAASSIA